MRNMKIRTKARADAGRVQEREAHEQIEDFLLHDEVDADADERSLDFLESRPDYSPPRGESEFIRITGLEASPGRRRYPEASVVRRVLAALPPRPAFSNSLASKIGCGVPMVWNIDKRWNLKPKDPKVLRKARVVEARNAMVAAKNASGITYEQRCEMVVGRRARREEGFEIAREVSKAIASAKTNGGRL